MQKIQIFILLILNALINSNATEKLVNKNGSHKGNLRKADVCIERCNEANLNYSLDSVISFVELYKDGTIDTITDYRYRYRELKVDIINNSYTAEIRRNTMFIKPFMSVIHGCTCSPIKSVVDTLKINYGKRPIIKLVQPSFDKEEIANIQNIGLELLKRDCGLVFFTYKYKIKEILNNPGLKFESCSDVHRCGEEEYITGCAVSDASIVNIGLDKYPKIGSYNNEIYFDPSKINTIDGELKWGMVLENEYGYDTTITIKSKK